jgi:hypothetical protein
MKRKCLVPGCLLAAIPLRAWAGKDELCTQLRAFQQVPFDKDREGKPIRCAGSVAGWTLRVALDSNAKWIFNLSLIIG